MNKSSVDKIIKKYFAALTEEPFTYKKETYKPKPLVVSPLLIRGGFRCLPNCGGCCLNFSLDYLPDEVTPESAVEQTVEFNGKQVVLKRDLQTGNTGYHCKFLDMKSGLCTIHEINPLSCDFEPIRVVQYADHYQLTQKPFGRAWNMLTINGERGALCEWDDPKTVPPEIDDVIRKLRRLEKWMEHFGLANRISKVIEAIPLLRKGEQIRITSGVEEEGIKGKWIRFQGQ